MPELDRLEADVGGKSSTVDLVVCRCFEPEELTAILDNEQSHLTGVGRIMLILGTSGAGWKKEICVRGFLDNRIMLTCTGSMDSGKVK